MTKPALLFKQSRILVVIGTEQFIAVSLQVEFLLTSAAHAVCWVELKGGLPLCHMDLLVTTPSQVAR
jgi:hypothetical protein